MNANVIALDKNLQVLCIDLTKMPQFDPTNFLLSRDKNIKVVVKANDLPKLVSLSERYSQLIVGITMKQADQNADISKLEILIGRLDNIQHLVLVGTGSKVPKLAELLRKFGSTLKTLGLICIQLESMRIPRFQQLKGIMIRNCSGDERQILQKSIQGLENIEMEPKVTGLPALEVAVNRFDALTWLHIGLEMKHQLNAVFEICGTGKVEGLILSSLDLSKIPARYNVNLGIKHLKVHYVEGSSQLMQIMSANCSTLETFKIFLEWSSIDFNSVTGLFNNLGQITFNGSHLAHCFGENISSLLNRCPNLKRTGLYILAKLEGTWINIFLLLSLSSGFIIHYSNNARI